jgi:hypothetical protein
MRHEATHSGFFFALDEVTLVPKAIGDLPSTPFFCIIGCWAWQYDPQPHLSVLTLTRALKY